MQIKQLTIGLPTQYNLSLSIKPLFYALRRTIIVSYLYVVRIFTVLFFKLRTFASSLLRRRNTSGESGLNYQNNDSSRKGLEKIKSTSKLLIIIVLSLVILIGGSRLLGRRGGSVASSESRVDVQEAKATKEINREFNFPLTDGSGKEIGNIKYLVESAELRDEIIVKGQRMTTVKDRTFLILTIKVTNEFDQRIQINTRDYIRLSVNGNKDEWLAPDIHSDPAEIQAISTKYTRVGFPISDSDTNLVVRVGEITGEKQEIELNF